MIQKRLSFDPMAYKKGTSRAGKQFVGSSGYITCLNLATRMNHREKQMNKLFSSKMETLIPSP